MENGYKNDKDNERDLVAKAQAGDIKSFENLLYLYEKRIFSYIYRFVSHKENAEDIAQETFLKVYRNLKNFNAQYKFKTWLYTIATHTTYDWLRKAKKQQELFIIDDVDSSFETIAPGDAYKDIENIEYIDNALQKLKPEYQTVINLFFREQLTYEEIAKILNVPLNTVKTYLYRAKKTLLAELTK